eukprot:3528765-Pyramimonas_sp.AAC.1
MPYNYTTHRGHEEELLWVRGLLEQSQHPIHMETSSADMSSNQHGTILHRVLPTDAQRARSSNARWRRD